MSLSAYKIALLREFVDFICEECKKEETKGGKLEPHRINHELGYNIRNIKMVCKKCHEKFTSAQRIASGVQGR